MFIDTEIVERVLKDHGSSLEKLLGKHKVPKQEQDWIYLIHHMHPPKKASEMETVHHCVMWEKKNEKGKNWEQKHVKDGKIFTHVLDVEVDKAPEVSYDHLNNAFKITIKKIKKEQYAVIDGMVSLKKTKWSDQDR